jgi:protoporphyrinogen oxidase
LKIAVIGAGISGATIARLLAADGHTVAVLESSDRAGGLCKSQNVDGFVFDEAGGHILFSKQKNVLDWQIERCGGLDQVQRTDRQTRIRWHDRWVPYPFENGVGHLTKEAIVDCMDGYIDAYLQRKQGIPCPDDFASWIDWRMGDGFAKHFMVPYNEKIWSCDLASMSSGWVAGRVPEAPLKDIIRAAVGIDTDGYTHQAIFYFPMEGGFETMVRGTVSGGGFELHTKTPVDKVSRQGDGYQVNGENFDLVINTAPLPLIAPCIEEIPEDIRADIKELRPISLVNVLFGLKVEEPPEPLSWIYLPFPEQGPANRITFFSNYSPRNAPAGHASYMAEVTHRGELEPDQAWIDALGRQLGKAGVFDSSRIVTTHFVNSPFAYIDQNLQFQARIDRVRTWFDNSGYITFGRFGRYEYHNSDQCIARAMEVHAHVREIAKTGAAATPSFA